MSSIVFHTKRVREVLKAPTGLFADFVFLLFAAAIVGMLIMMGRQASSTLQEKTIISLSLWKLPQYTLMSLCRGFAAYFLSLAFTLVYATVAAHNRRAEKVMIPALDILQSIPVLSFLPTVVLAMIALFPTREIGLEIACVVMIFTGQAWNMTFSMFGSIKGIPGPLREAASVYRFSAWRVFTVLELPASMIGLVWNSMMSFAGGWFVLTLSEAFTLQNKDFRLPGIGSYMGEAISAGDTRLFKLDPSGISRFDAAALWSWIPAVAAVIAMVVMIIAVDQLFWRPIVAWSERFKMEETADVDKPSSWVLDLLQHSRIYDFLKTRLSMLRQAKAGAPAISAAAPVELVGAAVGSTSAATSHTAVVDGVGADAGSSSATAVAELPHAAAPRVTSNGPSISYGPILKTVALWVFVAALIVGSLAGLWTIFKLLIALPIHDPTAGQDWVHVIAALMASLLRTSAAVAIGAIWTLPVGIIIGLSPKWSQRLQPVVQVVASFPANMIFPLITLFLAWIHFPFTMGCVALMLLGTQWYILFNVIAGAMAIPGDMKEVQVVFGTGWVKRWTRLYIPCVFPFLVTGLVTAAGGAWNATIVSEYVKIGDNAYVAFGVGSIISQATDAGNFPLLAAATVSLAVTVVLVNRFFWKKLYRVAEERYTLNV